MKGIKMQFLNSRDRLQNMCKQYLDFLSCLADLQSSRDLWIGCTDSRILANEVVGLQSCKLLIFLCVANLVVHSGLNCLIVNRCALKLLKVRCLMTVGNFSCSGVQAVLDQRKLRQFDNWMDYVQYVNSNRSHPHANASTR